jgi:tagatose-6-phosphate ketose/aldose isomerase
MSEFGWSEEEIERSGAQSTAREIAQQPHVWTKVEALASASATALERFLAPILARHNLRIVLTGAGTSAYIGECLAPAMIRQFQRVVEPIATTDLVATPRSSLLRDTPTLLVSFARSGNSPESVAVLDLAQSLVRECHHLIITCNAEGALRQRAQAMPNAYVLYLPDEVNDLGFAMTSSFTSMLLAAALAFKLLPAHSGAASAVAAIAQGARHVLDAWMPTIQDLVREDYERIIYLGAGAFKGLAREAALKMLELTDGAVVSIGETPLGFRHGPKTILNGTTLVVLLRSADPYTGRYDRDLLQELRNDGIAGRVLAIGPATAAAADTGELVLPAAGAAGGDLALCLQYAVFVQSLAMLQSVALGRSPDSPSTSGTVSRVVRGVTIHPLDAAP